MTSFEEAKAGNEGTILIASWGYIAFCKIYLSLGVLP
jgi:hypothetical protein